MLQLIDNQIIKLEEGKANEVLRTPECFTFHDAIDPSCWRCKVKVLCVEIQEQTRPPCYAELHDETVPECIACILESQCAEAQIIKEGTKMPTIVLRKPVSVVKPAAPVAVEPEVVEEVVVKPAAPAKKAGLKAAPKPAAPVVEEVAAPEVEDTYGLTEQPIEALRELAAQFELPTDGRKSVLVQRLLNSGSVVAHLQNMADSATVTEQAVASLSDGLKMADSVLLDLCMRLSEGQSLLLTPTNDGDVIVKAIGVPQPEPTEEVGKPAAKGLRGDAYNQEVMTPEYYSFMFVDAGDGTPWEKHTAEQKFKLAEEAGVEWVKHPDPKVNLMNMFNAVVGALGVEKYKPQYKSKAARDALK